MNFILNNGTKPPKKSAAIVRQETLARGQNINLT